jgi:hypothetical protein
MPGEFFGTTEGFRQFDLDQAQLANLGATARWHNAQADLEEGKAKEQQQQAAVLARMAQEQEPIRAGQEIDALDQTTELLARQSLALARAGLPNAAEATAKTSAELRLKKQQTKTSADQGAYRQSQVKEAQLNRLDGILAGVVDEASFNRAKMTAMSEYPDLKLPRQFDNYNPALVEQMKRSTKAGLDKIKSEREAADSLNRELDTESKIKFRTERTTALKEREKLMQEREERLAKGGGKVADPGMPSPAERDAAEAIITKNIEGLPPVEKRAAGLDVASRARQLRKTNGMTQSEALQAAFEEHRPWFETLEKNYLGVPDPFGGKESKYEKNAPPVPLPPKGTPLKVGTKYTLKNGSVVVWDGRQGVPVPAARAASAPSRAASAPASSLVDEALGLEDDGEE